MEMFSNLAKMPFIVQAEKLLSYLQIIALTVTCMTLYFTRTRVAVALRFT